MHLQKRLTANDIVGSFPLVSDELTYKFESESTDAQGWGYRFKVQPLYGEALTQTADEKGSKTTVRMEESKHNYDNNTNEFRHIVLRGAEAIKIVFDPNSVRLAMLSL